LSVVFVAQFEDIPGLAASIQRLWLLLKKPTISVKTFEKGRYTESGCWSFSYAAPVWLISLTKAAHWSLLNSLHYRAMRVVVG